MNPNFIAETEYGTLILNKNDRGVCGDIQRWGYFEKGQIGVIIRIIEKLLTQKDHVTFYDVGANIGTHSLAVAKTFGDKVTIRAFEAQRQIFYQLCGMVSLNGFRNVYPYNYAIGDYDTDHINALLPDYDAYQNFGGFELLPIEKSDNGDMVKNHTERVEVYPLDWFNEHVDFIKLDIEGMEEIVLNSSQDWIDAYKPVFFVEIQKSNVTNITSFFAEMGYTFHDHGSNGDLLALPPNFAL